MRALIVQPEQSQTTSSKSRARVNIGDETIGFEVVELADATFDPAAEEVAEQVFVRIKGFSLNFRDRSWIQAKARPGVNSRPDERAVGSEFVGEVLEVGSSVSRFQAGDRVMAEMAWPSNCIAGAVGGVPTNAASIELQGFHHGKLVKVPNAMPDEVAAAFVLGSQTAYCMVRRLGITSGEHVLVTAATSNTSLFAIAALLRVGAKITAVTRSRGQTDRLRALGVSHVFDAEQLGGRGDDLARFAADIRGFAAVVDPFADIYLMKSLSVLGLFGKYISCGMVSQQLFDEAAGPARVDVCAMMSMMITKNVTVLGNCLGLKEDLERAITDWTRGKLDVVLDSVVIESRIDDFLQRTFAADRFGKVVCLYSDQ